MGVRPPDNDELDKGPDVVEFGIAAVDARLDDEDLSYPVEVASLRREYGDLEIPYDASGQTVQLASVLEEVDSRAFESEQDMLNQLHPVFEEIRESSSSRLLGQLRSLVPF